jgi:hypothetical protein
MTPRIAALLLATALAGCAVQHRYTGQVTVRDTSLVAIEPDVKVVADAEEPMFFASNSYWLFHDGAWHKATTVRGPWLLVRKPPGAVLRISQPFAYARYRLDHPTDRVATATTTTVTATPSTTATPTTTPSTDPGMIMDPVANPAPSPLGDPDPFVH